MTIQEARAGFEAAWARFLPEGASAAGIEPGPDDLKALEKAIVRWLWATWLHPRGQLSAALAETAEAREIVRRGKIPVGLAR